MTKNTGNGSFSFLLPLFEMCWFYMGIAQISLDPPPPPLSNGQTWIKSAPNHPGKTLHPQTNMGKKCSKPSGQAFTPLLGNAHMETTHFKKGLPTIMKMQAMKLEKDNAMDDADVWEQKARAMKVLLLCLLDYNSYFSLSLSLRS